MSQIKTKQKLRTEEYPEQRPWIESLIGFLNKFVTEVVGILNDGLTFEDNFYGQEQLFEFRYQSDAISLPLRTTWRLGMPPKDLRVVEASENDREIIVLVAWRYTEKREVELSQVAKVTSPTDPPTTPTLSLLTQNSNYRIRVRITP